MPRGGLHALPGGDADAVQPGARSTALSGGAEPVPTVSRDARLLLTGVAVDAFGTGLTLPFLVVYLHAVRGLPLETVGLVVAVPAAVALALLGPLGTLVDRIGPRRVAIGSLAAAAAGALVLSTADTASAAVLARVLTGIGAAAGWPAQDALVASVVPSEVRQRYFGVSFALLNFGIGVGGVVGAVFVDVAHPGTFTAVYRADALTFLVPLVLLAVPLRHVGGPVAAGATPAHSGGGYRVVLADRVFRRLLALSFVAAFVGYGQVEGGWTAYANAVARVSTRSIGIAFAVNTTIIVVLQRTVLRRIEGRRRTRMLMLQAALWAAAWAVLGTAGLVPATPLAGVLLVVAFGAFAVGETFQSPVLPAIRNDVAPPALRGRYNAAAAIAFQIAHVTGPAAAGALLGRQHGDVYIAMLVGGCVVLGLAARRLEEVLPATANGIAAAVAAADDVPPARRTQDAG